MRAMRAGAVQHHALKARALDFIECGAEARQDRIENRHGHDYQLEAFDVASTSSCLSIYNPSMRSIDLNQMQVIMNGIDVDKELVMSMQMRFQNPVYQRQALCILVRACR
jgi:hypothetical protein